MEILGLVEGLSADELIAIARDLPSPGVLRLLTMLAAEQDPGKVYRDEELMFEWGVGREAGKVPRPPHRPTGLHAVHGAEAGAPSVGFAYSSGDIIQYVRERGCRLLRSDDAIVVREGGSGEGWGRCLGFSSSPTPSTTEHESDASNDQAELNMEAALSSKRKQVCR